jgi:hypothetical protein
VRPEDLVGRAQQDVGTERAAVGTPVGRVVHAVGPGQRAGATGGRGDASRVGDRAQRVGGQRERDDPVRLPKTASTSPGSSVPSGRIGASRTTSPWSSATRTQGATLASWSSWVTTISSPRRRVRATAWASRKLSVVMFGPKAISSGALPVSAAAAARAAATTSAV